MFSILVPRSVRGDGVEMDALSVLGQQFSTSLDAPLESSEHLSVFELASAEKKEKQIPRHLSRYWHRLCRLPFSSTLYFLFLLRMVMIYLDHLARMAARADQSDGAT